jgi:hypothetical protein
MLDNCCSPSTTYQTKDSWKWHMITEHPPNKFWVCSACYTNTRFEKEIDFSRHIEAQHMTGVSEDDMSAIVFACARQAPTDFWTCPLCPEKTTGNTAFLLDHVADHLKSFSLQSLPIPYWRKEVTESDFDPGYYLEHPKKYFATENIDTKIPDELCDQADHIEISAERKEPASETKGNDMMSTQYQGQTHAEILGSAPDPKPITKAITKLIPTPVLVQSSHPDSDTDRPFRSEWIWSEEYKRWYRQEFIKRSSYHCFLSLPKLIKELQRNGRQSGKKRSGKNIFAPTLEHSPAPSKGLGGFRSPLIL